MCENGIYALLWLVFGIKRWKSSSRYRWRRRWWRHRACRGPNWHWSGFGTKYIVVSANIKCLWHFDKCLENLCWVLCVSVAICSLQFWMEILLSFKRKLTRNKYRKLQRNNVGWCRNLDYCNLGYKCRTHFDKQTELCRGKFLLFSGQMSMFYIRNVLDMRNHKMQQNIAETTMYFVLPKSNKYKKYMDSETKISWKISMFIDWQVKTSFWSTVLMRFRFFIKNSPPKLRCLLAVLGLVNANGLPNWETMSVFVQLPTIRMVNTSFITEKLSWKMVAGTSKSPTSIFRRRTGR